MEEEAEWHLAMLVSQFPKRSCLKMSLLRTHLGVYLSGKFH